MKISIIIPCYNDEENLIQCLKTIPQDPFLETIIIDDGSFFPISQATFRFDSNKGPGLARQKGLEISSGEYIIFMDSDDCFIKENFKLYYEGINQNYEIIRDKQFYPYGTIQGICFKREVLNNQFLNDYFFQDIIFLIKILEQELKTLFTINLWVRKCNKNSITAFQNNYTADCLGLFSTSLFVQQKINKEIIQSRLKGALQEKYSNAYPAAGRRAYFFFKKLADKEKINNIDIIAELLHQDIDNYFSNEKEVVIKSLHKYINIALEL